LALPFPAPSMKKSTDRRDFSALEGVSGVEAITSKEIVLPWGISLVSGASSFVQEERSATPATKTNKNCLIS